MGAVRLLRAMGRTVVASDERATHPTVLCELARTDPGLALHAGRLVVPSGCSEVVLTPGLNPEWAEHREREPIARLGAAARRGQIALVSEVVLALGCVAAPRVVVGGTDGKSTTAAMVHHLLRALDVDALLGGNSWTALADVVVDAPGCSAVVAEVSAFQLWAPQRLNAEVGILTNVAEDHLDHYADVETYAAAKRRLLEGEVGLRVVNGEDARLATWASQWQAAGHAICRVEGPSADVAIRVSEGVLDLGDGRTVPLDRLSLPGAHNRRNALSALVAVGEVLAHLGRELDAEVLAEALAGFPGLPHRMERVRERAGVVWRNDSKATNLHASMAGIGALEGTVVAIVGGVDKGLALAPWLDVLRTRCRAVVAFGALRARLLREVGDDARFTGVETLEEAVGLAATLARPGDTVVLSPGASSFDQFAGFEARGEAFRALVKGLS